MPNQKGAQIDLLTKYAIGRSAIVGFQYKLANFSFGVSYDFPFFNDNPANLGALEVGLEIRKLVRTRATKNRIRKQTELNKKKLLIKRIPIQKPITKIYKADSLKAITDIDSAQNQIEIVKIDTSKIHTLAEVGKVKHEPLIVEKITLHFQFEFNSVDLDDETEKFRSTKRNISGR